MFKLQYVMDIIEHLHSKHGKEDLIAEWKWPARLLMYCAK